MAKKNEKKKSAKTVNGQKVPVAQLIDNELGALTSAHLTFVHKLFELTSPVQACATLHATHAAMMEKEMAIISAAMEKRTEKKNA